MEITQYISTLINKHNAELSEKDKLIADLQQQLCKIKYESEQNNVCSINIIQTEQDIINELKNTMP